MSRHCRLSAAICLAMLAWLAPCHAQLLSLRHLGQAEGLASLSVAAMSLDRDGYVWAGTESGLFRYNGYMFQRQGGAADVANASVRAIAQAEDKPGTLFVGTQQDLYAGDGRSFTPVRAGSRALSIGVGPTLTSTPDGRMLAVSGGWLWQVQHDAGGWVAQPSMKPAEVGFLPPKTSFSGVYAEPHGRVWLICGHALCERTQAGVRLWAGPQGVPEDDWRSFLTDEMGRLWVRGAEHLIRLDPGADRFTLQDPPNAALTSSYHFAPLVTDARGRLLTRTDAGLARFDGTRWQEFGAVNGLSRLAVRNLLRDRQGAIWMSNSGRGITRWLAYDKIESWTTAQGLMGEPVWSVARVDGRLLVITSNGCNELVPGVSLAAPCNIQGLPAGQPRQMVADSAGDLWFSYPHAVLHVPPGGRAATAVPVLAGADLLYADPRGRLWAAFDDHLMVLAADGSDRAAPQRFDYPDGRMGINRIATDASGGAWIISMKAVYRLAGGMWTRQAIPEAPGIGLQDLALDGDVLWIAGYPHGLLRADLAGGRIVAAGWIQSPLLTDSSVMFVRVDARHRVWVGTEQGIAVFDGTDWRRLSQFDGLVWNDVDEDSFLADPDGSVWIGTGNGLSHLKDPDALLARHRLDIRASHLAVGAADLVPASGDAAAEQDVPWSQARSLDAEISLMDFDYGPSTVFRMRLLGNDDQWFESGTPALHIASLAPGEYELQVIAVDREHHAQSGLLRVPFRLLAPWWEQIWFRLIEAIIAIGSAALLLRLWSRQMSAQRRRAERQLEEHRVLLHRATHDALTGLLNRGAIMDILAAEIERAAAGQQPVAVVLIDIDHFKRINDTYGHATGDAVLCELAEHLQGQVRSVDAVGRYGGEELLLVMPGLQEAHPVTVIERLRVSVGAWRLKGDPPGLHITASFGVAWVRTAADSPAKLVERADAALYAAKQSGRDRVVYAPLEAA